MSEINAHFRIVRFRTKGLYLCMSDHIFQQSADYAFSLFTEEIEKLKTAYSKLQESFQTVNEELALKTIKLTRLNRYLQLTLKHISDALLFIDLEGTVVICNVSAQKLLNLKNEEILSKKFWEVFKDDTFGFSMKEALKFGLSPRLIYRNEFEISTSFIYEGPKEDHGMLLILKDLSEKKKLQLIANRNDRMKELGEMAASIVHEIRNPLGGIRGYASLLYRDLEKEPHLQEMAHTIIEGTKTLEKLVNALLHYSKPIQIEVQTLDLGAFLKKAIKFIKIDPAFPSNVKLAMHIPDEPILVPFDPEALKSAMLNLIFNAFQAMAQGGTLTISLLKMHTSCEISVSDTGIGMEQQQLEYLFSPFYTTKKGGNGLGLVETQKIVQAHLGTIIPRSKPGVGTTFTIALPLKR